MKQRVLVTGGRHFADRELMWEELDALHAANPFVTLSHGACHLGGADILAGEWAREHDVPEDPWPVDHRLDGPWPGAGPRRNQRMFLGVKPDLVIAFPGDRGTKNMIGLAHAAGTPVTIIEPRE